MGVELFEKAGQVALAPRPSRVRAFYIDCPRRLSRISARAGTVYRLPL
jgi:hypothetical protein